jgi:adenine-specific DNA-methyltransferase
MALSSRPSGFVLADGTGVGSEEGRERNFIVAGENLETLKLLLPRYRGLVRMIYIDPPYNTGKDFVYPDDYSQSESEYRGAIEGRIPSTNANGPSDGRYHARWLSMMYPRLLLARDFLPDGGAIFVSIDDNELPNLRAILGEIFGEDNFIGSFVWLTKREAKGIPTRTMFIKNHEYVVVYAKNASAFSFRGERRTTESFRNPDDDPRGPWKRQYLQRFGQGFPVRTLKNPVNGMKFRFETPYTEEKMAEWARDGRIIFPEIQDRYPARKEFFREYRNENKPVLSFLDLFSTKVNTEKVKPLFGDVKVFQFTKPVELIKALIRAFAGPDDLILDFFAGSGTTAHAILELNREDSSSLSFILVQIPEPVDPKSEAGKAGFADIAEICIERARRVIETLDRESPETAGNRGFGVKRLEHPQASYH